MTLYLSVITSLFYSNMLSFCLGMIALSILGSRPKNKPLSLAISTVGAHKNLTQNRPSFFQSTVWIKDTEKTTQRQICFGETSFRFARWQNDWWLEAHPEALIIIGNHLCFQELWFVIKDVGVCKIGLRIPSEPQWYNIYADPFLLVKAESNGSKLIFACWGNHTLSVGHYTSLCGLCLTPVSEICLTCTLSGIRPKTSADMTGQISVTPANVFKRLPSGCRGSWEVLEMIALTVRDANHSWKGDSTFGCYLLRGRKKNTLKSLTLGQFDL